MDFNILTVDFLKLVDFHKKKICMTMVFFFFLLKKS